MHGINRRTYRYEQPKNFHFIRSHRKYCKYLRKFRHKKAHSIDELSPNLLKDVTNEVSKPLAFIINKSLPSGIVPGLSKISKVTPFYKSDWKSDFSNYCPISVLPCISKVLESSTVNFEIILKNLTFLKAANSNSVHEDLRK